MKKSIKAIGIIGTIVTMGLMLGCAYLLGATQARTKVEIKITARANSIIPDGYIPLNDDFRNNFIDMRKVIDYTADDNGLQIFLDNGTGYYWER